MTGWTTAAIPSQAGRLAIVTGATGGLGYATALALAAAGAEVVLASRSDSKGADALDRLRAAAPGAMASFARLELDSLRSVTAFAERLLGPGRGIDVLVNNAAVMALPRRRETEDGVEVQMATNYLGHFALTARLLPLLRRRPASRVVTLSSLAARRAVLPLDDMQSERRYAPTRVYGQTKLATLMFALELQRRSDAHGWGLASIAAHPGIARTNIIANGPAQNGRVRGLWRFAQLLAPLVTQSAADGALPVLFAATAPEARGGGYYGPSGFGEMKGPPAAAKVPPQANDAAAAARLWNASERLTGLAFG